jgi:pimeloyl-ACP methyl ester carboxylesterase
MRRLAWILALVAAIAAAPAGAQRHEMNGATLDGCVSPGAGASIVKLKTSRGRIPGAVLGNGRVGVVLSNQSQQNLCSWLPFANKLVQRGFSVLLYDYGYGTYRSEVRGAVQVLRRRGARRIALVGSSQGAKVALHAAAFKPVRPAAVVSISAERYLGSTDIRKDVARVRVPTLFVSSRGDPFGATKAARAFYSASPAKVKRLLLLPGTAHGFELFGGENGESVVASILDFLASATSG